MDGIKRYFDLMSDVREGNARGLGAASDQALPAVWPQYVALVLGIVLEPYFSAYQVSGTWDLGGIAGRVLFAVVAGVVALPAVYRNAFDPQKPMVVQLSAIFTAGMGWQSLLGTALAATMGV